MKGLITPAHEESIITKTTRLLLEDSANTMRKYIEENIEDIIFNIRMENIKQKKTTMKIYIDKTETRFDETPDEVVGKCLADFYFYGFATHYRIFFHESHISGVLYHREDWSIPEKEQAIKEYLIKNITN